MTTARDFRELQRRNLLTMPNESLVWPDAVALLFKFPGRAALEDVTDAQLLRVADRIPDASTIPPILRRGDWVAIVQKIRFDRGNVAAASLTSGVKFILPGPRGAGELRFAIKPDLGSDPQGLGNVSTALQVALEQAPARGNALVQIGQVATGVTVSAGRAIGRAAGAALRPIALPLILLALSVGLVIFLARRQR